MDVPLGPFKNEKYIAEPLSDLLGSQRAFLEIHVSNVMMCKSFIYVLI